MEPGKRYPVLYVLPVQGDKHPEFGDSMLEAKKADLANRFGIICVYSSFTHVPWFGNHDTDPHLLQEDYILHALFLL